MSLETTEIQRVFKMNIGETIETLTDPNPLMTANEVCDFFSGQYPELTNATIENKGLIDDLLVYEFKTILGTKA